MPIHHQKMMKSTIVQFFEILETFCEYFDKCILYGEDDFYDYITIPEEHNTDIIADDKKPDYIDAEMYRSISEIYEFNRDIIDYLREEPKSYRDFFISELIPKHIKELERILSREDIELTIYRFDIDPDSTHDIYKNLNCLYHILTNVDSLVEDEETLQKLLDYNIVYNHTIDGYKNRKKQKPESESNEQEARTDAFTWYGKPSELATLMATLAENGYINTPMRDNNERNNEGFARKIITHFRLQNGAYRSLVNSLKDNTISPNNRFKIAMDKLPMKS